MDTPLRKIRQKKLLTLGAVSRATGIDVGNLSRLERRAQAASPEVAAKLAAFFKISELEILYPERYGKGKAA